MLYVTAIAFQVGVVASVVLGAVCVVRRILVGCRTRRWVSTIEQAEVTPAVGTPTGSPSEKAPVEIWDHVVQFYAHDDELVDAVSGYLGAAIAAEEIVVVVATKEHRQAFDVALAASGADLDAARTSGSYIALDAAETVSRFVIDGYVDRHLFESVVGQLMRTASAAGRPVRVYGEMVALLWEAGQINAAVDLEGLWNELGSVLPFSLYCAYPTHSVTGAAHRADLEAICHLHADVVGSGPPRHPEHLNEQETTLLLPVEGDVDEEMLSELFSLMDDGSADGLVLACNLFLVGVPEHLADAERAVAEGRLGDAALVAHSLRGTSGSFGARRLYQLAEHLQLACERDEPGQAGPLIEAMQSAFTTFRPVLTARLSTIAYH